MVPLEGPAHYFLPAVDNWRVLSLINSIAGMVLGSAFIWGIALLYEAVRGVEGMGRGDVKLMALIGAFLGVKLTLLVLLLGSLIGSFFGLFLILWVWMKRLLRRRRTHRAETASVSRSRAWNSAILIYRNFEIPFGVFLGAAALVSAFCGTALVRWYIISPGWAGCTEISSRFSALEAQLDTERRQKQGRRIGREPDHAASGLPQELIQYWA